MEILITRPEREVLEKMKKGYYLVKSDNGEGLGYKPGEISHPVKAGTIEAMTKRGLVKKSMNFRNGKASKKWLLTDEGRAYKS